MPGIPGGKIEELLLQRGLLLWEMRSEWWTAKPRSLVPLDLKYVRGASMVGEPCFVLTMTPQNYFQYSQQRPQLFFLFPFKILLYTGSTLYFKNILLSCTLISKIFELPFCTQLTNTSGVSLLLYVALHHYCSGSIKFCYLFLMHSLWNCSQSDQFRGAVA